MVRYDDISNLVMVFYARLLVDHFGLYVFVFGNDGARIPMAGVYLRYSTVDVD